LAIRFDGVCGHAVDFQESLRDSSSLASLRGVDAFAHVLRFSKVTACRARRVDLEGYPGVREKGLLRLEGKDYIVKDGDVLEIRHG
jgi:ribosome-binding ATPase YchF (GTP1/OBG family)